MPVQDNSNDALIIFSVTLATFMAMLYSYIVNASLPTMARYFGVVLFETIFSQIIQLPGRDQTLASPAL